jgi:very-short-patch-repair endonuclease
MRLKYNEHLKPIARQLRSNLTDAEELLWYRLRRKQILGVQFYRQRAIGNYIVDFFAPKAKLIIELDGSQHFEKEHIEKDKIRDSYMNTLGYRVLRYDNRQVLLTLQSVVENIYKVIANIRNPNPLNSSEIPPNPPLEKGGTGPSKC